MIALVDYGAGNLSSVRKALAAVGAGFYTPQTPAELHSARAIIIPGVGHFGATAALDHAWRTAILGSVQGGTPLLGICLGLQYLFEGSDEAPTLSGLGLLAGRCTLLPPTLKVPHVGWNTLSFPRPSTLFDGVANETAVYFTHSYAAPVTPDSVAVTTHGATFAAGVERGRVFGAQFHPEKSGESGLRVLRNFLQIARSRDHQIPRSSRC